LRKDSSEFNRSSIQSDGFRPNCRQCQSKWHKQYYLRTRILKGTKSGPPIKDLTGKRFGRLTVISRVTNDKQGKAQWSCLCDCGQQVIVRRASLRAGVTRSCGCLAKEAACIAVKAMRRKCGQDLPPGIGARNDVLSEYKRAAKTRNYEWQLSNEQALLLMKSNCHYCGVEPSSKRSISVNGSFVYNGLDRKDNSQGYVPENVVPCCPICNRAKMDMPYCEFIAWARRIAACHG
jgi:hypothetical protein